MTGKKNQATVTAPARLFRITDFSKFSLENLEVSKRISGWQLEANTNKTKIRSAIWRIYFDSLVSVELVEIFTTSLLSLYGIQGRNESGNILALTSGIFARGLREK
ncbi:DUF317 domain-containing protein [Geitlerinema sp. PCC 7407]|uniref:DUF317 domain-containing protein n=1 Tax=Geitlerinema sp. PCC 7407 TaxID=1173025 RepID=UPI0012370A31|nr:DUF317 domain-containing protein [Geitlerinema sp. PCC 7407]